MIRAWLASNKSLVATVASSSVVVALVAAAAIVSTGYSAQRLDLNDASVWVTNRVDQFIGRANTEVFELNSIVESEGEDVEVIQSGATVLLFDRTDAKLDIVDPATSEVLDSVALPPNGPEVFLAGSNVVIYSQGTGELWSLPIDQLAAFEATQAPSLNLGADTVVSVDPAGLLFGFSAETQQVFEVDAATASTVLATSRTAFDDPDGRFSISAVNGSWAVLEADSAVLETAAGSLSLAAAIDAGGNPVLQKPSTDGEGVLVSFSGGLLAVPASGTPVSLVDGRAGAAAAPVIVGGCIFAGWSDGTAWRGCDGDSSVLNLDGMPTAPALEFQSNGDRVVLNDARAGAAWAVQANGELIDNWDDLISVLDDEDDVEQNDDSTPPQTEQLQVPPVAVNDAFGARPARATLLPVLLNDYDPNGDVLVISNTDGLDENLGRLDIINNAQQLQLTLPAGAVGELVFGYTISDGRGGSASATVTVTVRSPDQNSPPVQVRATQTEVVSGGQVTVQVLGDWVDPDGDPMFVASAAVPAPDVVSHKADGEIIYSDKGSGSSGRKTITVVVSDGTAQGVGTLAVEVSAAGQVPLIAEPFPVFAYAGVEVRVAPLDHVRGGNGTVRLNAVPSKSGVTIKANFERGTFRVTSESVGTHYLEYVVTDGVQTVTGIVRVDVAAPPDSNTTPITVPKTIFVQSTKSETIDVAATDIDPAGGVLLVTGVMNVPTNSLVRAEVLEQRAVRVTLEGPLAGPVIFNYRISNGLAEAEGTITVIEIPSPEVLQPPIARDDSATVRVGDAVTIDVMANDEHPDGESITLDPVLVDDVGEDSGLLFASGNTLRYLAPDHAGNFTAQYQILGPFGQTAQAQVSIQVREPSLDTNHAPAPSRITARVLSGEQVRIDIPLTGIDPDGDSVQLVGVETNPEKGAVVEVGTNYILYEAGQYSAGTDTFTYTLIDSLGARAMGTVRVGISARLEGARNPVAIEDEVRARPGATVSVQVLENDSDPDGSTLTVTAVEPNDDETVAEILDGSVVRITPPSEVSRYVVLYTIENEYGGTSSNYVTVVVSNDAPLAYPIAADTVLTLSDILDDSTIDVDVLKSVFFADGDADDLGVAVLPGYALPGYPAAQVLADKRIRVTVGDESQIIPFAVSHPEDPSVRSYAFIWVPGFNDALPQIDRRAPRLVVNSEDTLTIDLNDYVLAVGGKQVRLTDSSTVSATHSDGESLVVDRDTLQFTSADLYFGPASISFEVTDGTSATDPAGRKSTLVLPIQVNARENQPPAFNGAVIDFEPGQEKTIDLQRLTTYPYDDDLDELVYSVIGSQPTGFSYSLSGQTLTLRADESAVKGTSTALTLGVRDAVNEGRSGRIELSVVSSTRPTVKPVADNATTRRGQTTVIDVLENDGATNPFPGEALRVVQVIGIDSAALPAGVSVGLTQNNSRVSVTVGASASPVDINLQYQVADATGDSDRYAWGVIHISIQDVPDVPAKLVRQANSFAGGELKLRITPPQTNNSPVTNYRITSSSHGAYSHDCGTQLICTLAGLSVGELYTFEVTATNGIGDSPASAPSDAYSIDYLPAAPSSVSAVPSAASAAPAGGSVDVSWTAVQNPSPGTVVAGYTVLVNGTVSRQVAAGTSAVTITGLANDVVYSIDVYATNAAQVISAAEWNRASTTVHTVGPPTLPNPAPQATSGVDGRITVSWGPSGSNGGAPVSYTVARVDGAVSAVDCATGSVLAAGVTSPHVDSSAVDGATYTYIVRSDNGSYCAASGTGATVSLVAPGPTTAAPTVDARSTGQYDIQSNALSAGGTVVKFQYLLSSDGTWRDLPADGWVTGLGSPGTLYALPVDVSFRACRTSSDGYCGTPSGATTLVPLNARVSAAECTVGSVPTIATPTNTGAVTGSYQVAYNVPLLFIDNWSSFGSSADPAPVGATGMRVKATVDGLEDLGYGEFPCITQ